MSMIFIFLISALIFLAGLTFMIVGIVIKSKKHYIPGIIGMAITFVICVVMIYMFFFKLGKNFSNNVLTKDNINIIKNIKINQGNVDEDTFSITFKTYISHENGNKKDVSEENFNYNFYPSAKGFITDSKKNLIYIRLYSEKEILDKGININSVSNKIPAEGAAPEVIISMTFSSEYYDELKLLMLDDNKNILDSSILKIQQPAGSSANLTFRFNNNSGLTDSKYYYLTGKSFNTALLKNKPDENENE